MYKLTLKMTLQTFDVYHFDASDFTEFYKKINHENVVVDKGYVKGMTPIVTGELIAHTVGDVTPYDVQSMFATYIKAYVSDVLCSLHFQLAWYEAMGQIYRLFEQAISQTSTMRLHCGEPNPDGTVWERTFKFESPTHEETILVSVSKEENEEEK